MVSRGFVAAAAGQDRSGCRTFVARSLNFRRPRFGAAEARPCCPGQWPCAWPVNNRSSQSIPARTLPGTSPLGAAAATVGAQHDCACATRNQASLRADAEGSSAEKWRGSGCRAGRVGMVHPTNASGGSRGWANAQPLEISLSVEGDAALPVVVRVCGRPAHVANVTMAVKTGQRHPQVVQLGGFQIFVPGPLDQVLRAAKEFVAP